LRVLFAPFLETIEAGTPRRTALPVLPVVKPDESERQLKGATFRGPIASPTLLIRNGSDNVAGRQGVKASVVVQNRLYVFGTAVVRFE
jgi:hypothetical protein